MEDKSKVIVMQKKHFSAKNKYRSLNYMKAYQNDNYLIQILKQTKKNISDRKTIVLKVDLKNLLDKIFDEIRFQNDPLIKKIKEENDNFTLEYKSLSENFQKTTDKIFTDLINLYQARGYKRPNLSYDHNLFKINALIEESTEKIQSDFQMTPLNKNIDPRNTPANKTIAYLRKLSRMIYAKQSKEEIPDNLYPKLSVPRMRRKSIMNYIHERNQKLRSSIQSLKSLLEPDSIKNIDDFPKKNKFYVADRNIGRKRTGSISKTQIKTLNLARSRRQSFNNSSLLTRKENKFKMIENNFSSSNTNEDATKKKLINLGKLSESTESKKVLITPKDQINQSKIGNLFLNSPKDLDNKTIFNKFKMERNSPKFLSSTKIQFSYNKNNPKSIKMERNASDTNQKKPGRISKEIENSAPTIKQNTQIVSTKNIRSHIKLCKNAFLKNQKLAKNPNSDTKNNLFVKTQAQDKTRDLYIIQKKLDFGNNSRNCTELDTPKSKKKEFIINAYKKLSKGNYKNVESTLRKYLRDVKGLDVEEQDLTLLHYSYKNAKNNLQEVQEKIMNKDIGKKTERLYINNHMIKRVSPILNLMREKERNIERLEKFYEVTK